MNFSLVTNRAQTPSALLPLHKLCPVPGVPFPLGETFISIVSVAVPT